MAEVCDQQSLAADAGDLWKRFLRASYLMRSEHHHDPVYKRYDQAWADQFEYVFKRLKLPGDPYAAANHLKTRLASAPAFDEAKPVIEALRPHYRLALLSNADDDFLNEVLDRNDLRFDTVVSSEQAGAIKPNPAIFGFAAGVLGIPPQHILYAGDNPIPDVLGAHQRRHAGCLDQPHQPAPFPPDPRAHAPPAIVVGLAAAARALIPTQLANPRPILCISVSHLCLLWLQSTM